MNPFWLICFKWVVQPPTSCSPLISSHTKTGDALKWEKIYICQLSRVHIAGEAIQRIPLLETQFWKPWFFLAGGNTSEKHRLPGTVPQPTPWSCNPNHLMFGIFTYILVHVYMVKCREIYQSHGCYGVMIAQPILFGPSGHESVGRD